MYYIKFFKDNEDGYTLEYNNLSEAQRDCDRYSRKDGIEGGFLSGYDELAIYDENDECIAIYDK